MHVICGCERLTICRQDGDFKKYLDMVATVTPPSPQLHNDTYAYYINIYNAFAINMIIAHPCKTSWLGLAAYVLTIIMVCVFSKCEPIESIWDIGSLLHPVWKMTAGTIGGKDYSLDDIEDYLRDPTPLKLVLQYTSSC